MRINKQQLADYIGVHPTRVKKHYQAYLDILETKRTYLTIFDVAKIDNIPVYHCAQLFGVKGQKLALFSTL